MSNPINTGRPEHDGHLTMSVPASLPPASSDLGQTYGLPPEAAQGGAASRSLDSSRSSHRLLAFLALVVLASMGVVMLTQLLD